MTGNIDTDQHIAPNRDLPARERLIAAGASLFASKGYGGASVREICILAATSSNMIHHYFGNKQGLYDTVLAGLSENVLVVPVRIIASPPRNRQDLISRLEIFVEETLEALIAQRHLYELVVRESIIFSVFDHYNEQLIKFLDAGKSAGIIRAQLDTEMLTGLILDRLGNQILFAPWISENVGQSIFSGAPYKNRWLAANLDLIFNGILTAGGPE